ncbi:MAG: hypothetical protein M3126_06160 [Candidatus Eremiobacteraeota bacterium]|nr:hypothetical protein [Candidatus Eremiobacteraeota bacterium]
MYCKPTVLALAALIGMSACGHAGADELPKVPAGFTITKIASVSGARELAVASNGDLLVGTAGSDVYLIAGADTSPGAPKVFVHLNDSPVAGVAIANNTLYLGAQFGVWQLPYHAGDRRATAPPRKIASLRTSGVSSDHVTTTVAVSGSKLYASVGSSCNNCQPELDDTRATVQEMDMDGAHRAPQAIHIRNAIALAVNSATGSVWAGVAGQDELAHGHPYEIFDAITLQGGIVDYGWPYCYENRRAVSSQHDCSHAPIARAVFPAYETPIGAAFYPANLKGRYVFPRRYWGGAFVTLHGSWHTPLVAPRVAFVPMNGDDPQHAVNWKDPGAQWSEFVSGFANAGGTRLARPTGIAVGPQGDLFIADDYSGSVFRIRPAR